MPIRRREAQIVSALVLFLCAPFRPPFALVRAFVAHPPRASAAKWRGRSNTPSYSPSSAALLSKSQIHKNESLYQHGPRSGLFMTAKSDGKRKLAAYMAFLCGWADVALFARYKTFATMLTGNALWLSLSAAEQRYRDALYYSSVIASYLVGLIVFRKTDLRLKQRTMPVAAIVVATLFCASECVYSLSQGAFQWLPVMMLASGYGIVNAVGTEVAGTLTFVVTGHMTKLTNLAVDRVSSQRKHPLTITEKNAVKENAAVVLGFFGGALSASFLRQVLKKVLTGEFAILGLLYGCLFLWQDMEAIGGAWWLRNRFCDEVDDDGSMCDVEEEESIGTAAGNSTTAMGGVSTGK